MKRLSFYFSLWLTLVSGSLCGQILPNTILAGGLASFDSDLNEELLQHVSFDAAAALDGVFALGARTHHTQAFFFRDDREDSRWTINALTLYGRYYFLHRKNIAPYLELATGLERTAIQPADTAFTDLSLAGAIGQNWWFTPTTALESQARLQYVRPDAGSARLFFSFRLQWQLFLPPDYQGLGKRPVNLSDNRWLVGGYAQLGWDLTEGTFARFNGQLFPVLGLRVGPRTITGAYLGLAASADDEFQYRLLPFARWYLSPDDRFKLFAEAGAGFDLTTTEIKTEAHFCLRPGAGITHFLTSNLALDGFVGILGKDDLETAGSWRGRLIADLTLRVFI